MAAEQRPVVLLSLRAHTAYSTDTSTRAVLWLTAEKRMGQGCVAPSHCGWTWWVWSFGCPVQSKCQQLFCWVRMDLAPGKSMTKPICSKEEVISGVSVCQPLLCAAGTGRASLAEWGHTRAPRPTLCFPCWHYESSVNIYTACSREGHAGTAKHQSASWQHCQGIFQTLSKLLKILWKWKINIRCNAKHSQRWTCCGGGGDIWLARKCCFGKTLVMPLTLVGSSEPQNYKTELCEKNKKSKAKD